jgi:DNA helicase IV
MVGPMGELETERAVVDRAEQRLLAIRDEAAAVGSEVLETERGGLDQARIERDIRVTHAWRRLKGLALTDDPLVIGRLDDDRGEVIRIGRAAIDDEDREPLVIDWRAPVAAPFYRATPLDPQGIVRRRHYQYRGRYLVGLDDELLDTSAAATHELQLVGEGALMAALERERTGRMTDIVATIQREQDEVIRSPIGGVLVVQGGPGTGKTAIALHRAAYLLYSNRFQLETTGVLLVGPNPVFLSYIERVLPALGEHTVTLATPASLVEGIEATARDTAAAARVKGDLRMVKVLRRAIALMARPLREDLFVPEGSVRVRLSVDFSRSVVSQARALRGPHNRRRRRVEQWVGDELVREWEAARRRLVTARRIGPEGATVEPEEGPSRKEQLLANPVARKALDRMWPVLTAEGVVSGLLDHRVLLERAARNILDKDEVDALVQSRQSSDGWTPADVGLIDEAKVLLGSGAAPARRKRPSASSAEDVERQAMIDRIMADHEPLCPNCDQALSWNSRRRRWVCEQRDCGKTWTAEEVMGDTRQQLFESILAHVSEATAGEQPQPLGPGADRTFGHVLVDEAQDLSPMQWRMIARRCPNRSVTVTGDLAQASEAWGAKQWDSALTPLLAGSDVPVRTAELTINYRTPAEVMEVAARVLAEVAPDQRPATPARHSGVAPRLVDLDVEEIAREAAAAVGEGRVGVIVPRSRAVDLRQRLQDLVAADAVLDAPVAVLSLDEAKGLEFDSVVVVEPAELLGDYADGLRALYVALTRTTRWLTVVATKPLPESLAAAFA